MFASVFVSTRAENYHLRKIEACRNEETLRGRPKNEPLISRVDTVLIATARSPLTDHDIAQRQPADTVSRTARDARRSFRTTDTL